MAKETKENGQGKPSEAPRREPTFDERLAVEGWTVYYNVWKLDNLKNPDTKIQSFGCYDMASKKQIVINVPTDVMLNALTESAKKVATKI